MAAAKEEVAQEDLIKSKIKTKNKLTWRLLQRGNFAFCSLGLSHLMTTISDYKTQINLPHGILKKQKTPKNKPSATKEMKMC